MGNEVDSVGQSERTRGPGRSDLSHTMSDHHLRFYAPGLQHSRESSLESEDHRLHHGRFLGGSVVAEESLAQRPAEMLHKMGLGLIYEAAEGRVFQECTTHGLPLRALTAVDEGHARSLARRRVGGGAFQIG